MCPSTAGTRLLEWGAIRSITRGDDHGLIGDDDHPRVGFRCLRILAPLENLPTFMAHLDDGRGGRLRPVDFEEVDVRSQLLELTGGRDPDKCIDAVWKPCTAAATDLPEMRTDEVARHQH